MSELRGPEGHKASVSAPPPLYRSARAVLILVLVLSVYVLGFLSADQGLFTNRYIQIAKFQIKNIFWPEEPELTFNTRTLSTIFLRLRLDEMKVPLVRSGSGGGLTSVGEHVLLLTHEGSIFAVSGQIARRTRIRLPDNGFDAYRAASESEEYRDRQHTFGRFRYNDILYYSHATGAGLVVSYTEWLSDQECYGTTIALLTLSTTDDSPEEIEARSDHWEVIYRTKPCLPLKKEFRALEGHIAGGRIAYLHPDKVLLGSGDYHWDGVYAPTAYAQLSSNDYGKILEIDLNAKTARHFSVGNRNVQGLLIDNAGQTWAVEQGPRGGDELNLIEDGRNYGWPEATLGTRYNNLPWPSANEYGRHNDFAAPVYAWIPSVATSGITQIEGFDPSWDRDLLVASLRGQSLYRLRFREGRVLFSEPIPIGHRIRYVHQHTDGRIILWTDSKLLVFVSRDETTLTHAFVDALISDLALDPGREDRLKSALAACAECHSFGAEENASAPSLSTIFGQRIASEPFQSYSEGLVFRTGVWTEEELTEFLTNPDAYAPGTTMPQPELSSEAIGDVITVLKALKTAE